MNRAFDGEHLHRRRLSEQAGAWLLLILATLSFAVAGAVLLLGWL